MTPDEMLATSAASRIPPLEKIGDHNIHEVLRMVTPMYADDFSDLIRNYFESTLVRWSIASGYSRPGYHVYGSNGLPVDYVPSDHLFWVLIDKNYQHLHDSGGRPPEWASKDEDGNRRIGRHSSYSDLILCEGCGSVHRMKSRALVPREMIFIRCDRIRYPTVFEGLWVGAEQLNSLVRT